MKKIVCLVLAIIMTFGCLGNVAVFAEKNDKFYLFDGMETYQTAELNTSNDSYCLFGSNANETEISTDIVYSGEKSIILSGRQSDVSSIKAVDIFGKELNKNDVGKTFRISFMLYPDKNSGVYKGRIKDVPDPEQYRYTDEELKESQGTEIAVTMTGPNGKNYTYRQGGSGIEEKTFVKWNQWNAVTLYYTVEDRFLSNGSKDDLSNPYLDSVRIWQRNIDYSLNKGIVDTFYIDHMIVEEVGAKVETAISGKDVSVNVQYLNGCSDDYARSALFEYENGRLIGSYIGEKAKTSEGFAFAKTNFIYTRRSDTSVVYSIVFGNDYTNPVSPLAEICDQPSDYEFVTREMAEKRAKEMLDLSTATYTDALNEGIMKEERYFFATKDLYTNQDTSKVYEDAPTLNVSDKTTVALKFDISDVDFSSTSHAYIRLYTSKVKKAGDVNLCDELSGKNISSLQVETPEVVYMFDVSAYINDVLSNGKKEITIMASSVNSDVDFISNETTQRSFRPCLIMEGVGMKMGEKKVSSYDYSNYIDVMKRKKTPADTFVPTPTRVLSSIKDYTQVDKAPEVNKYGSYTHKKYNATGFFRLELIDGRWWIIDPEGYPYIYNGVAYVVYNHSTKTDKFEEKYGDVKGWASKIPDELRRYGFNGCGTTSQYEILLNDISSDTIPLPQLVREYSFITGYDKDSLEDNMLSVFDPAFDSYAEGIARRYIAPYKDNPYILGWSTDNEPIANDDMLASYLTCDPYVKGNEYNYYTAWAWLKSRHGENATAKDITSEDKNDWVEFVYDRYMRVCYDAIRKYDTNHLIMGPKLDKPHKGSFRAMKKYTDVVLYDYYGNAWTADMAQIDEWYRWSGKPMINAEWYVKGMDACTPESELTNEAGVGWTVMTQKERGDYYQSFVLNMLESKVFVGWHWYRYMDNDPRYKNNHYSNIDSNKGIVTRDFEYQEEFLSYVKTMNDNVLGIIEYFDR